MTLLKCKMCGGDIVLTGESHGICEYCGSEITLPKISDDKRADMFNRGNYFRQKGLFDMAYSAYEHIVAEDKTDAEAHWCLMLCRYGIEYVKDPRTGEYMPTCSRMSIYSVLDDIDYLAALEYSDEYTKNIYRKEAEKIYAIQQKFLDISSKEAPYDVFICFKAESDNGERTQGSVVGQEIYDRLTQEGIRTFFSRITLEDKIGEEYEPYIFAALNSAKVMLVMSDNPDHLQARWVKNEWMRYLSMLDSDSSKKMIPVCVGISPYDLPDEIPQVQAIDWSRIDALETLLPIIFQSTGKGSAAPATVKPAGKDAKSTFNRVRQHLEDGSPNLAKRLLDEYLIQNPSDWEAHLYLTFIDFGVSSLSQLKNCLGAHSVTESARFNAALKYSKGGKRLELEDFKEEYDKKWYYMKGKEAFDKEDYKTAKDYFTKCPTYSDARDLLKKSAAEISKEEAEKAAQAAAVRKEKRKNKYENDLKFIAGKVQQQYPEEYSENNRLKTKANNYKIKGPYFWKTTLVNLLFFVFSAIGVLSVINLSGNSSGLKGVSLDFYIPGFFDSLKASVAISTLFNAQLLGVHLFFLLFAFLWLCCILTKLSVSFPDDVDTINPFTSDDVIVILVLGALIALAAAVLCSWINVLFVLVEIFVFAVSFIYIIYEIIHLLITIPLGTPWRKTAKKYINHKKNTMEPIYNTLRKQIETDYQTSEKNDL